MKNAMMMMMKISSVWSVIKVLKFIYKTNRMSRTTERNTQKVTWPFAQSKQKNYGRSMTENPLIQLDYVSIASIFYL